MTVSVVVPWRGGCDHRKAAWAWVAGRYAQAHPEWEIVLGYSPDELPFSRAQAIIDGASRAAGDVVVVADADVWCDGIAEAVARTDWSGWAIPHRRIYRLARDSTAEVLAGADWHGLRLSRDNERDRVPYVGNEAGTLLAVTAELLEAVPPDRRFVGWGQEDDAWAAALHTLAGAPWRGQAKCVHLWHPPQPRLTRAIGSADSHALFLAYNRARGRPEQMRALLAEGAIADTGGGIGHTSPGTGASPREQS